MKLYHLGKRLPSPHSHPRMEGCGVFLTPEWRPVFRYFGQSRRNYPRIYIFDVPRAVIRQCGGLKRYDRATEIFILEEYWDQVKFLGSRETPRGLKSRPIQEKIEHRLNQERRALGREATVRFISWRRGISEKEALKLLRFPWKLSAKEEKVRRAVTAFYQRGLPLRPTEKKWLEEAGVPVYCRRLKGKVSK